MRPEISRHLTLPCALCGRAAAEISLLPSRAEGVGTWHDRDRLERTDFLGTVVKFGSYEDLLAFYEVVARADYEAARAVDADFVAFHCRACAADYCASCWQLSEPVFEEGFYEYTLGQCPQGHEQVVDD